MTTLKAPFPWFGGKSRVADVVWRAFGDVPNYVEPFYGSGAVLLGRPSPGKIETVNDIDCFVANFWRAVVAAPEDVALACDWPVNEADLHARHRWLVAKLDFREAMRADPEYFHAQVAGWWVWGLSQWIGGGWCASPRETERGAGKRPHVSGNHMGKGVHAGKPPNLSSHGGTGAGVHRKMPDLYTRGRGRGIRAAAPEKSPSLPARLVRTQLPSLNGCGAGVHRKMPDLYTRGVHGADAPPCLEWFVALRERLRRVRVVCGDWNRVLGNSVIGTTKSRSSGMNPCGIFLDPPYSDDERDPHLYASDDGRVSLEVAKWAVAHGNDPDLRIALCGYEGEHEMPSSWACHAWKAGGGYAGADNENARRERIWFSPHCLPLESKQVEMFGRTA
jgi:hypothetical protein